MDNDKMTRCKIKAVIGAGIALILFGGCGYDQTSNDQVASTENVSNIDKSENDIKEDNVDITEASWEDGYTIVLNAYREEAEKISKDGLYWDSFDEIPAIPNVEDTIIEMEFYNQFGPFAFMLKDLDGNEIPELFICRATEEFDSGVIYQIFTWHDGKTIELLGNLGYRNGICTICQDNLLKVESSGTATDYGNTIYCLPKNSTELKVVEQFFAIQNKEDSAKSDFFWFSSDGEKTLITEEKYLEYVQNYDEQADLRYIEGTQDNIAHISDFTVPEDEVNSVELDTSTIIEDQSFDIRLNEWGEVRFVSCRPDKDKSPNADASFYLMDHEQVIYKMPSVYENDIRDWELFEGISFVAFKDINEDKKDEIIVGIQYITGVGPQGMIPRTEVRIFEDKGDSFEYSKELSEYVTNSIPEDGTIQDVYNIIMK